MIYEVVRKLVRSRITHLVILSLVMVLFAACAPSSYLGYQGRLLDASGNPVNGTVNITVGFYTASDCTGTALHEETHNGVTVTDGLFNFPIGPGSGTGAQPGSSGLDPKVVSSAKDIYMKVEVGGEQVSCQQLMAAPKALNLAGGSFISYLGSASDGRAALNIGAFNGAPALAVSAISTGNGDLINGCQETDAVDVDQCESLVFKVENDGDVYTDRGFHCGLNINAGGDGIFSESELDPCLEDNQPADFAEMLPTGEEPEPGDVLVIGPDGLLGRSHEPYASNVAGVHSTRPSYLGNSGMLGEEGYVPLAMMGVVPVKVVDENGPIQPGDLLTTSSTPGHAMVAGPEAPQGTIIGKALGSLESGTGVIQMLVMLQ